MRKKMIFLKISAFYKYVIDNTENMAEYARWDYGRHPTDEMIIGYINGGYMYYTEENGELTSAVAVTPVSPRTSRIILSANSWAVIL